MALSLPRISTGRITVSNAGAEQIFGYSTVELIGRATPLAFHLPAEVTARAQKVSAQLGRNVSGFEVFVAATRHEGPEEREWTYVRNDGSQLSVLLVVIIRRDPTGQAIGYLGISRDITERKRTDVAMRRALDELELRVRVRTTDLLTAQTLAHLGSWEWDLATDGQRWVDEQFRIVGYAPQAITPSYDLFVEAAGFLVRRSYRDRRISS